MNENILYGIVKKFSGLKIEKIKKLNYVGYIKYHFEFDIIDIYIFLDFLDIISPTPKHKDNWRRKMVKECGEKEMKNTWTYFSIESNELHTLKPFLIKRNKEIAKNILLNK